MRRGFVRRRLRHGPLRLLVVGVLFIGGFAPFLAAALLFGPRLEELKAKPAEVVGSFVMGAGGLAFGLWLVWRAVGALVRLDSHSDLVALRRYGPLDAVLTDIDAEVYGKPRPLRLGTLLRCYHLYPSPVTFAGIRFSSPRRG
jgi:hypothetical protein